MHFAGSEQQSIGSVVNSIKCVCCNSVEVLINGVRIREKYKIVQVKRAQLFLDAIRLCPDDNISIRMADINNVETLIARDIYYHKPCLEKFLARHYRNMTTCIICSETINKQYNLLSIDEIKQLLEKSRTNNDLGLSTKILGKYDEEKGIVTSYIYAHSQCRLKYIATGQFSKADIYELYLVPLIEDLLSREYGITLSQIRDFLSQKNPGIQFYNNIIKDFLLKRFSDRISFCPPYRKNESEVVFPSTIDPKSMIAKLQVLNELRSAGKVLRSKLRDMSFGLDDSFCDAEDLRASLRDTRMPESLIEFLGAFLNISKADFQNQIETDNPFQSEEDYNEDNAHDDNSTLSESSTIPNKLLKASSLFQCMFYMVNNGMKKCPYHVMLAHTIYDISKSSGLITACNHLGLSVSYPTLLRMRALLGFYIICVCSFGNVPLPSHFDPNLPTLVALDVFDHNDASSPIGKNDTHDSVMVLF